MIIYVSLAVAIAGAFLWVAASPKIAELGRVAWGAGLLAFLLRMGAETFQLFKP